MAGCPAGSPLQPALSGMGARHLTEDQAFDVLRRYSQENNIELRKVARLICERGTL